MGGMRGTNRRDMEKVGRTFWNFWILTYYYWLFFVVRRWGDDVRVGEWASNRDPPKKTGGKVIKCNKVVNEMK